MQIEAHIVNAFIDGDRGGNPAGVVLNADQLSPEQKQAVASKMGLSETAFVSRSTVATRKLEFFTPSRQIPHCGHATVATFSLLRQLGQLGEGNHSKETVDGTRKIVIAADKAFMEQAAPSYQDLDLSSPVAASALRGLGIESHQLQPDFSPCVVNTGNAFLMVGLALESDLRGLQVNQAEIQAVSETLDLIGFYAFSLQTQRPGRSAGTRMFAPRFGIPEEAGTGMAAGPLACLLHKQLHPQQTRFEIEQGWLMQPASPSVITVDLQTQGDQIQGLLAGGSAQVTESRIIEL